MARSLFASPEFILTESSFIIVASIAFYEILVGDFIWAQQEEARRQQQQQQQQNQQNGMKSRSLSPGRGGRYHNRPPPSSRRGSPNEETYLLYPSRSSQLGMNNNRVNTTTTTTTSEEQQGYYTSPGGTRFSGRGSSGDSTRRLFYKMTLFATLSRFVLLPLETICLSQSDNSTIPTYISTLLQILLRLSQTLPDVVLASALGLLVIFCVKIAFAALPPLTPDGGSPAVAKVDGNQQQQQNLTREVLPGNTEVKKGQDNNNAQGRKEKDTVNEEATSNTLGDSLCTSIARLSRTILASKKTFRVWNSILSISYTLIFIEALLIPHAPLSECERHLWILMTSIYSFLFLSLFYASALMIRAIQCGLLQQKNSCSLGIRLGGTFILLAVMFIDRLVRFGLLTQHAIGYVGDSSDPNERIQNIYRRITIEYTFAESLPILLILIMMHRKRKVMQNDVLIKSINNLFGSAGKLGSFSARASESQFDTSSPENVTNGGGINSSSSSTATRLGGTRRFQTYGGTSNAPRRNTSSTVGNYAANPGRVLDRGSGLHITVGGRG